MSKRHVEATQPQYKKGTELHPDDRLHVLAAYIHRYTGNHRPQWVKDTAGHVNYPLQFKDDNDWLENTVWTVRADGRLDRRHNTCYSSPTWPNNPELRKENT